MRVALVARGTAPDRRSGFDVHSLGLARALARAGVEVEVFAARALAGLAPLAQRREERDSEGRDPQERDPKRRTFAVTFVNVPDTEPASPESERRLVEAFGAFLDRERPQVVHFEHLVGFGPGAVDEARRRGLPTVFVAHDWWAAHDSRHAVLPDLTAFEPGDLEREARGALALRWLAGLSGSERARLGPGLGAAFQSVLLEQLSAATGARLEAFLHVPPTPTAGRGARGARAEGSALEQEVERLRARQAAKRAALGQVDARFATSRHLARRLSTLVGRAFSFRAPGVDRDTIRAAERPVRTLEGTLEDTAEVTADLGTDSRDRQDRSSQTKAQQATPLRVGFLGSITKERGLHVLLAACDGLAGKVELHIHGDSSDRAYVSRMRHRAETMGAIWHGAYTQDELPRRLAELDAVCLPSVWPDNAPLVLREAYAAGLPVVVSDTEALRESVLVARDGDEAGGPDAPGRVAQGQGVEGAGTATALGLLVPPGDSGALRAALVRLADDETLRASLVAAVRHLEGPLTKRLGQEAGEWLATYAQLVGAVERRRVPTDVPAHLAGLARQVAALEALPTRTLFQEVTRGLERLGAAVGLDASPHELMALAVGRGSRTRDERGADARAIEWLRSSVRELGEARTNLEARSRWREEELRGLADRIGWQEQRLAERELELQTLRAERDDHGSVREVLEDERHTLREEIARREAEQLRLGEQVEEARNALRSLTDERDWLRDTLDRGNEELRWLREHVAGDIEDALTDREAIEMHFERLCREHETLTQHEVWLRRQVVELFEGLGAPAGAVQRAPTQPTGAVQRAPTQGGATSPTPVFAPRDDPHAADDPTMLRPFDRALEEGRARFARLVSELAWRRGEMDAARIAATNLFTRFAGGELATRARSWPAVFDVEMPRPAQFELPGSAEENTGVVLPAPRGGVQGLRDGVGAGLPQQRAPSPVGPREALVRPTEERP